MLDRRTWAKIPPPLQTWKHSAQFSTADDWMFASPVQIGRLPWSYNQVWPVYQLQRYFVKRLQRLGLRVNFEPIISAA